VVLILQKPYADEHRGGTGMKRIWFSAIGIIMFLFLVMTVQLQAQNNGQDMEKLRDYAPMVFLDCRGCDRDFFREELTYVNWVRDRKDADVHILVTNQTTGSGGQEYSFAFIGLRGYEGIDNTLIYNSGPNDVRDEIRRGQLEVLERGLFPYVLKTPIADYINLSFRQKLQPTKVTDPWNFWVFSISGDGRMGGEVSRKTRSLDLNLAAVRVTPDLKIRIGASGDWDERIYDYEDEYIESIQEEKDLAGMVVFSLGEHFSAGGWVEAEAATYNNVDLRFTIAPAVEYDLFPYSESTRRQLRFLYKLGANRVKYIEETIYEKTEETLFNQTLTVTWEMREPWGSTSASLEGSHYFHDPSMYRVVLRGYLSFRVFKGLSVDLSGRYERIHDQLNLPVGEASLDEVLLQRKELATNYEYSLSVGLRYTFGSVFSNVVNPRFEGSRYRRYR